MARIQHLAIASTDPEKQAAFYKDVFGFEEIKRLDNPRCHGLCSPMGPSTSRC
ncbi:MAG: VOC family protein [Rhodospirillales bacterium]